MKVLILSQWYPPEPMKQLSDMAETLQEFGHDVHVLTGFPNWPTGEIYDGYDLSLRQDERIGEVAVTRVPLYPDHSSVRYKRLANFSSFALSAAALGRWYVERPDVIHTIQPPTVCAAAWVLSRCWRVPFTYEVQDMWPETLSATEMISSPRLLSIVGTYCDWAYGRAAAIRVISPGFKKNLLAKGVDPGKVRVIPNWVDTEYYKPLARDDELAGELDCVGTFNVIYAGSIGPAQGLGVLIDAAERLIDLSDVQFLVFGDGLGYDDLRRRSALSPGRVRFMGRYPMATMNRIYSLADVLLVHLCEDPLFKITIPHKTLTYLASGKPVLVAAEGDVADVVRESGAGFTCPPSDPAALAETVRRLRSLSSPEREGMGKLGRTAAIERFGKHRLVRELEAMLKDAVELKAPSHN